MEKNTHHKNTTSVRSKKQNSKVIMEQKRRKRSLLTLWRITKYGANSFVRNAWLSVAATVVMTLTLSIIFTSLASKAILNDTISEVKDKVDLSIYLKKDVNENDLQTIQKSLANLSSVKEVKYISPEQARKNFAENNSSDEKFRAALLEATNEFPATLNIKMVDIGNTTELKQFVDNDKTIQNNLHKTRKPTYGSRKDIINSISNTSNFIEKIGLVAGIIFVILASLIIFNTIRMAIFNRREEIYMMKLIGANKSFIAGPFIIEAVICGILAAVLAMTICYVGIFLIKDKLLVYGVPVESLVTFLQSHFIVVLIGLMLTGSAIGVLSAFTATRKYLKI